MPLYPMINWMESHKTPIKCNIITVSSTPLVRYNNILRSPGEGGDFHNHPYLQLLIVTSGEVLIEVNGIQFRLQAGCVSVIPPGIEHAVYSLDGYEQVGLDMDLYDSDTMMGVAGMMRKYVQTERIFESKAILKTAKQTLPMFINRSDLSVARLHASFLQILNEVIAEEVYGHGTRFDEKFSALINQHIGDRLTVDDIAQELFLSVSQLERLTRRFFGMGAIAYYKKCKLQHAQTLLKFSDMKIFDIVEATGFGNAANFTVFFSKHFKMSPSEYRKKEHQKNMLDWS